MQASYVTALSQRETDAFIRLPLCLSPQGKKHRHTTEGEPWHALARSLVTELETITVYSYFALRSQFCKNKIFFARFLFVFFSLRPYIFPLTLSFHFQCKWLQGRKKKSFGTALNANTEALLHVKENLQAKLASSTNKGAVSITRHEHHNTVL